MYEIFNMATGKAVIGFDLFKTPEEARRAIWYAGRMFDWDVRKVG